MIVFGVLDDALAQIPLERTPLRYSGKMRAVTPDLASLFGPLVIRRQRQRWKSKRSHSPDDWPRFEEAYDRRVHVTSIDQILADLRDLGAETTCVAVTLQGSDFVVEGELAEIVGAVCHDELEWDDETAQNVIVVCKPGHLAFYKDDYAIYGIVHRA